VNYKLDLELVSREGEVKNTICKEVTVVNIPPVSDANVSGFCEIAHGSFLKGKHEVKFAVNLEKNSFTCSEAMKVRIETEIVAGPTDAPMLNASMEIWECAVVDLNGFKQERSRRLTSERVNDIRTEFSCTLNLPSKLARFASQSVHFKVSHWLIASLLVDGGASSGSVAIPVAIHPK
jgi:hypothetical protein